MVENTARSKNVTNTNVKVPSIFRCSCLCANVTLTMPLESREQDAPALSTCSSRQLKHLNHQLRATGNAMRTVTCHLITRFGTAGGERGLGGSELQAAQGRTDEASACDAHDSKRDDDEFIAVLLCLPYV